MQSDRSEKTIYISNILMSYQKHVILILRVFGAIKNYMSAYLQLSSGQFATSGKRCLVGVQLKLK